MSSPKRRTAKAQSRRSTAAAAAEGRAKSAAPPKPVADRKGDRRDAATRLAASVERALSGRPARRAHAEGVQALMAAACKLYSAQIEAGERFTAVRTSAAASARPMS